MKSNKIEPSRWAQTNFPPGVDRTLADMLRAARDLPVPDQLGGSRLSMRVRGRSSMGSMRWSLVVLALFLLIGTAGVVAGTQVFRTRERPVPSQATMPSLPPESLRSPSRTLKEQPLPAAQPEVVQPQEELASASVQKALGAANAPRRVRPVTQDALATEPQSSALGEGRALSEIYRLLRIDKNADLALQRLDDFAVTFPASSLHSEAQLARVEALIATSKYGEAARVLEHVNPSSNSLRRMVRVTRGELLVKQHACEQAVVEFDTVIAENRQDVFDERALYGRASCRLAFGDVDRARSDLARYLERHPNGVRAANIKKQLQASL